MQVVARAPLHAMADALVVLTSAPNASTRIDLGVSDRRHILESILRPSNVFAPHYQTWQIETTDGRIRTGMLIGTNLDEYTYVDTKGDTFKPNARTIAESRSVPTSIR